MHHGFYPSIRYRDHQAAQVGMVDRALEWAYSANKQQSAVQGVESGTAAEDAQRLPDQSRLRAALQKMRAFVDVGCGVGGSSRHIARAYGRKDVRGVGISLSPYQIKRAKQFTAAANLTSNLEYKVVDAMHMPFPDNSFDLGECAQS